MFTNNYWEGECKNTKNYKNEFINQTSIFTPFKILPEKTLAKEILNAQIKYKYKL